MSFADRELELAYMQLSDTLRPSCGRPTPTSGRPTPATRSAATPSSCTEFLNNIRHFGPDRYVPRIEAVLDGYAW